MGSLAIEGHDVQGFHDEAETLRRVRRSFTTSVRRISRQIHTRQIQVRLALCRAGQHVQGAAGQISVSGLLNTTDL